MSLRIPPRNVSQDFPHHFPQDVPQDFPWDLPRISLIISLGFHPTQVLSQDFPRIPPRIFSRKSPGFPSSAKGPSQFVPSSPKLFWAITCNMWPCYGQRPLDSAWFLQSATLIFSTPDSIVGAPGQGLDPRRPRCPFLWGRGETHNCVEGLMPHAVSQDSSRGK